MGPKGFEPSTYGSLRLLFRAEPYKTVALTRLSYGPNRIKRKTSNIKMLLKLKLYSGDEKIPQQNKFNTPSVIDTLARQ